MKNAKSTKKEKQAAKSKAKSSRKSPEQTDALQIDDAPILEASDAVLGTLSSAPDTHAQEQPEAPARSMRKQDTDETASETPREETASAPGVLSAEPAQVLALAPLRLPRGGFIALRKSGGLHFSAREVVVYPDGRVAYDARGVPQKEHNRLPRVLNDAQVHSLRHLLDQTNFWRMESAGKQNPDAFAYEIAARVGQRANEIEVFDGSIPEKVQPLLERLTKLLPPETEP